MKNLKNFAIAAVTCVVVAALGFLVIKKREPSDVRCFDPASGTVSEECLKSLTNACPVTAKDADGDCVSDMDEMRNCRSYLDHPEKNGNVSPTTPDKCGDGIDSDCGGTDCPDPPMSAKERFDGCWQNPADGSEHFWKMDEPGASEHIPPDWYRWDRLHSGPC